ncbi:MAG: hypothetical protein JSU06_00640 [Actinobacteria bacterium]|nr:hypothetical protein [Actinomycetota bacterium]
MREGLAALGIGALAIACCGLAPIVVAALGGAALAPLLGVLFAVLLAAALLGALAWHRHRRSCALPPEEKW